MKIIDSFKGRVNITKLVYSLRFLGLVMMLSNVMNGQSLSLTFIAFALIMVPDVVKGSKRERIAAITVVVGAAILALYGIFSESSELAFMGFTVMFLFTGLAVITAGFFYFYKLWVYGNDYRNE